MCSSDHLHSEYAFVELVPIASIQQPFPLGSLTFAALSCLPDAYADELTLPGEDQKVPVPYGNLVAYAKYLIHKHNDPLLRFILQFHSYSEACCVSQATTELQIASSPIELITELETLRNNGLLLDLNDPEVQRSVKAGRIILLP